MDLDPYQITGANWLANGAAGSTGFAALGDDPGLGKTAQAIRAMDVLDLKRALVICPAAIKSVWVNEFKKWSHQQPRVLEVDEPAMLGAWISGKFDVAVVSYEFATNYSGHIRSQLIPVLILDEAHYLKNPSSQRTRAVYGTEAARIACIAGSAAHVFALSGTFMKNTALDLYPLMRASGAWTKRYSEFERAFFELDWSTKSPTMVVRERDLPSLRDMVSSVVLRRSVRLLNLPELRTTTLSVAGDQSELLAFLREFPGLSAAVMTAVEEGNLSFVDAQHIGTLRRLTAEAKAPGFGRYLAETIQNGLDCTVVIGIHTKALKIIKKVLEEKKIRAAMLIGETPHAEREKVVAGFQAGEIDVIIGNMITAGTGHTMTRSRSIYMFEEDWSPANNIQAIGRIRRKGQKRSMLATFVSLAGSVDERTSARVAQKTEQILQVDPTAFG